MNSVNRLFIVLALLLLGFALPVSAQIFGPEGMNMPGEFNAWTNPPYINSMAGIEKAGGTFLLDTSLATLRYKTVIHIDAAGADTVGGTYQWLFTSGPTGTYNNTWKDVLVSMNTVQTYHWQGSNNDTVTLVNGNYYTVNFQDNGYANTSAIWMPTSAPPVTLPTVTQFPLAPSVLQGRTVTVSITASGTPSAQENVYVRYTTDNWATSNLALANFTGANGSAVIPAQTAGTTVSYYVFSTTLSNPASNFDLVTLNSNTNNKANYTYQVVSGNYLWTGAVDTVWQNAANWTPSRTSANITDTLTFNGAQSRQPFDTVGVTVARLVFSSGFTKITLGNKAGTININCTGNSPDAFYIGPGANVYLSTLSSSSRGDTVSLTGASAGGQVYGTLTLDGRVLLKSYNTVARLNFNSGAIFVDSLLSGNCFGPGSATDTVRQNGVEFKAGSQFWYYQGSNPQALGQPKSLVVFDHGSLYRQLSNSTPSWSGRTMGNVEYRISIDKFLNAYGSYNHLRVTISPDLILDTLRLFSDPRGRFDTLSLVGSGRLIVNGNIELNSGTIFNDTVLTVFAGGRDQRVLSSGLVTTNFAKGDSVAAGSTLHLVNTVMVSSGQSSVISGTLNPDTATLTGPGSLKVNSGGVAQVKASTFSGNYTHTGGTTLNTGSTVEYSGSAAQTIDNTLAYKNLSLNNAAGAALAGTTTVAGTLNLANGTLGLTTNNLNLAGGLTNSSGYTGSGYINLNGASSQAISGSGTYNNLTLNNAAGATLSNDITESGLLTVTTGHLNTNGHTLTLGASGALAEAGNGNIVEGVVAATRTVSAAAPKAGRLPRAFETFGGIGFDIDPAGGTLPGLTTVTRTTGTPQGFAGQSLARYYDVSAATSSGLNATVVFHFDSASAEINGNSRTNLILWRSSDAGANWSSVGGTVDTVAGTITKTNVANLSRFTASSIPMVNTNATTSEITSGSLTIPGSISSLTTTQGQELAVFSFMVTDEGGDGVGTVLHSVRLKKGAANTATDWSGFIQGADLFNGATNLGTATISSDSLTWTGTPIVTIPDNDSLQLTVKIWLKNSLPAGADNKVLEFKINQQTDVTASASGSQFATPGTDVVGAPGTSVNVVAAELSFETVLGTQKTGVPFTVIVAATDTNGNADADYTDSVHMSIGSGTGTLGGTNPKAAVAGQATFSNLTVTGAGFFTLHAISGALTATTSNSFLVTSPAVFKVAGSIGDTADWDAPSTWVVVSGASATGIPSGQDQAILDNTFKSGSYVVTVGKTVTDSVQQLTLGPTSPTTNTATLLIPNVSGQPVNSIVWGDGNPGNYDIVIDSGGVFWNSVSGGATNAGPYIKGYGIDSILIKKGGKWVHNTLAYATYFAGLSQLLDGDYGTLVIDMPPGNTDLNASGNFFPNLTFNNNYGSGLIYLYGGSGGGHGGGIPMTIKGNFTINTGAVDSMGMGADVPIVVHGNIINNGTTKFGRSPLIFAGSTAQTVTGNPITLDDGLVMMNNAGVTLGVSLTVTGGQVQTGGTYSSPDGAFFVSVPTGGLLTTGANSITLNPNGNIFEGTNPVLGNVTATRTAAQNALQTFGGIGYEINAAGGAPGSTTIARKTGVASSGNGHTSIRRYYDVTPTVNSALNATVGFSYAPSELNGIPEANLVLQKSTDGGTTWTGKSGSINASLHKITATGVQSFSRWTAASVDSPLFITHTLVVRKFQDADGNIATTIDQTPKKWRLFLYQDSITAGTLVNTQNLNNGVMVTGNLPGGTYIATEADTAGWLHLGTAIHGSSLHDTLYATSATADTVTVSDTHPGSVDTLDFINQQQSGLSVTKVQDRDGNPATTADQVAKKWHLTIYKTTVAPGNIVADADTNQITLFGIQAGVYIAVEADSGPSWVRLNGNHARSDTLVVLANQVVADTFMNFRPNTLIIGKFQDNDGQFATSADRTAKPWFLKVNADSATGPVVVSGVFAADTLRNLGDGTYIVSEADSTGWIRLGYLVNAAPVAGSADHVTVSLVNGQAATIDFVNAPPIYGKYFRGFRQDSVGLDVDNFGKVGKYVKRKPYNVDFSFSLTAPKTSTLTLTFSMLSSGAVDTGNVTLDTIASWSNAKTVTTGAIDSGKTVTVMGRGYKGSFMKVSYAWATTPKATKGKVLTFTTNILRLPMPNRVNALLETFTQGGFNPNGLVVGRIRTDSAKFYGWFQAPKYTDVLKTLKDKTGLQTGNPHGFDVFVNGKPVVKQQKSLPPTKYTNVLLADAIALKLNIAASGLGITPPGFGELIYNDASSPYDGMMLRDIAAFADSVMMGYPVDTSKLVHNVPTHFNVRHFAGAGLFATLDTAIARANAAFEGRPDTVKFSDSLIFKGVRPLMDVAYLRANPDVMPARIIPTPYAVPQVPMAYMLYQNYPNPFNPTTTIQFDLPQQSFVTLKIYNILGQEVATLLDHQMLQDGTQEVQFNAVNFASGVYFYRIVAQGLDDDGSAMGTFQTVKKMMLIK